MADQSQNQRTVKTPDGRTVVVLPGETDNQAIARAVREPGRLQGTTPLTRIIVGPQGELIVARNGETDAQALAAYQNSPRLGMISAGSPEFAFAPTSGKQGAATILKMLGLGASMAIPGVQVPAALGRGLISGALGAGANELEGQSPTAGFLWNLVPELLGAGVAKNAPAAGVRGALRVSGLNLTDDARKKTLDAFMREAAQARRAGQKPIRVGEQGVPEARAEAVGAQMRGKEAASSYRPNVATMVETQGGPGAGRSSTIGKDMQEKTGASFDPNKLDRTLDKAERTFLASQVYKRGKEIYQHLDISEEDILALSDEELLKWAQSTDMRAEDFGDLTRALKREARPIITKRATGEYVPPAQAIREGDLQSKYASQGQEALKQNIPGLSEDLERYGDLSRIESINNLIHETPGRASVRGGMVGAQAGAVGGRTGGLFGGALGMAASPKNISRVGFMTGRMFEPGRMANPINIARTGDISEDFVRELMALIYGRQQEER